MLNCTEVESSVRILMMTAQAEVFPVTPGARLEKRFPSRAFHHVGQSNPLSGGRPRLSRQSIDFQGMSMHCKEGGDGENSIRHLLGDQCHESLMALI